MTIQNDLQTRLHTEQMLNMADAIQECTIDHDLDAWYNHVTSKELNDIIRDVDRSTQRGLDLHTGLQVSRDYQ